MNIRWQCRLALSLGLLVLGGAGGWYVPPLQAQGPAATLDRPVAVRDNPPRIDNAVRPTGLFGSQNSDAVVRAPVLATPTARPLPVGPSVNPSPSAPSLFGSEPAPYTWRQPPAPTPTIPPGSVISQTPTPLPPGAIVSPLTPVPDGASVVPPGVVPGPGLGGGMIGDPVCDGCMGGVCCPDGCGGGGCCCDGCCGGCCDDGCCGWGGCCPPGNRWWATGEYLLWFVRGQPLPPLVTTGSITDAVPGALGQPGTTILYGNNNVGGGLFSGGRFRGGYWFCDDHLLGLDFGGFFLGEGSSTFSTRSSGTPFLARPFVNAITGAQSAEPVAAPSASFGGLFGLTGGVTVSSRSRLWGVEANLRSNLCCGCNYYIDVIAGWRLLSLTESLNIQESPTVVNSTLPVAVPNGSMSFLSDHFGTSNLFNGGQIGGYGEYRLGNWSLGVRSTVALGVTQQLVNINGTNLTTIPGQAPVTTAGGLLAQPSNIGHHVHDVFGVVPEVGLNLGYQFTNHIRGFVGYNFLYWSSVVRPGNQIDPSVNPNFIAGSPTTGGPQHPAFIPHGSDFWAQGVTFGLEFRY